MKTQSICGTEKMPLEELGKRHAIGLEVSVDYDGSEAEPRTWDYPGCPAHLEITGVTVTSYGSDTHQLVRADRPDWFVMLDRIAARQINEYDLSERLGDDY